MLYGDYLLAHHLVPYCELYQLFKPRCEHHLHGLNELPVRNRALIKLNQHC